MSGYRGVRLSEMLFWDYNNRTFDYRGTTIFHFKPKLSRNWFIGLCYYITLMTDRILQRCLSKKSLTITVQFSITGTSNV